MATRGARQPWCHSSGNGWLEVAATAAVARVLVASWVHVVYRAWVASSCPLLFLLHKWTLSRPSPSLSEVPGLLQDITSHLTDNVGKRKKLLLKWVRDLWPLLVRGYTTIQSFLLIPDPTALQWTASKVKIFASCENGLTTPTRERGLRAVLEGFLWSRELL